MTSKNEVHCDKCGEDITYTGNSVDYRVVLGSQGKLPWYRREGKSGGAMTDMMIYDPFPQTMHFCNTVCLAMWAHETFPDAVAEWDKQAKRREHFARQRGSIGE